MQHVTHAMHDQARKRRAFSCLIGEDTFNHPIERVGPAGRPRVRHINTLNAPRLRRQALQCDDGVHIVGIDADKNLKVAVAKRCLKALKHRRQGGGLLPCRDHDGDGLLASATQLIDRQRGITPAQRPAHAPRPIPRINKQVVEE